MLRINTLLSYSPYEETQSNETLCFSSNYEYIEQKYIATQRIQKVYCDAVQKCNFVYST